MKRYICLGGGITSRADGDYHYIPATRLPELYKVNPDECIFVEESEDFGRKTRGCRDLIVLYPRSDGAYIVPKTLTL